MMDINDDLNNNDENHDQQQQEVEQQQPAVADAIIADSDSNSDEEEDNGDDDDDDDDGAEEGDSDSDNESAVAADTIIVRGNRRAKLMSLLEQYDDCPSRTRNNIDELVLELLNNAEDDVHQMLCDQNADPEHYRGLDINCDTIKEVRTIVQIFPEVLSRRKESRWLDEGPLEDEENEDEGWYDAEGDGEYPIQCCFMLYGPDHNSCFNLKAGPFIATLAQLGVELDQFRDEERGGLLSANSLGWGHDRVLQRLVNHGYETGEEQDTVYLQLLVQLREMCLLKKEDILDHNLVHDLCRQFHFSERRFRFLIEWDPTVLTQTDEHGYLPLLWVVYRSIQIFRSVFETGIIYYPHKKGISLLFKKNNNNLTPLQLGCGKIYGRNEFMDVVEDTITSYYSEETPLNIVDTLLTAAIDDTIHLDCVFFLLRRRPNVLLDLLLGSTTTTTNSNDGDTGIDGSNDDGGGGNGSHQEHNDDDRDRDDKNNINKEKGRKEDNNDMLIADVEIDANTDAKEKNRMRKRKREIP